MEYESVIGDYSGFNEGDFVMTSLFFAKQDESLVKGSVVKEDLSVMDAYLPHSEVGLHLIQNISFPVSEGKESSIKVGMLRCPGMDVIDAVGLLHVHMQELSV